MQCDTARAWGCLWHCDFTFSCAPKGLVPRYRELQTVCSRCCSPSDVCLHFHISPTRGICWLLLYCWEKWTRVCGALLYRGTHGQWHCTGWGSCLVFDISWGSQASLPAWSADHVCCSFCSAILSSPRYTLKKGCFQDQRGALNVECYSGLPSSSWVISLPSTPKKAMFGLWRCCKQHHWENAPRYPVHWILHRKSGTSRWWVKEHLQL